MPRFPGNAGGDSRGGLVERDHQLDEIDGALAGAVAGRGRLVLLEGPAGIGKTALLAEACDRAAAAGVTVLAARAAELEGGFPYGVVRQLLEPTVREAGRPRQQRLLAGPAAHARPAVLGSPYDAADPGEQAFAVVHGLYWLVANLAAEAPLALLLDDLHWADAPTLRYLVYLAHRIDGLAATVIVSVRTDEQGSNQPLINVLESTTGAHVSLPKPLTEAAVASLLATDFGQQPDAAFVRACVHATGGNPFYVRELAAALISDGIEPTSDATGRISAAAPRRIARVTLARLGRLSDDAAKLARAIAVLGRDARLPTAAALADLTEAEALRALDALAAADVVLAAGTLEFRHPIVRSAIYEELAPGARSAAHHRAASLLRDEGAELDAVASHLLVTEPVGAADTIATLRAAAVHALVLGAPDSAAGYLLRALQEGPQRAIRATVLLELGLAEKLAHQPAASERFEQVRNLSKEPVTRARALVEQAETLAYAGEWERALALLDCALAELPDATAPLALRAAATQATLTAFDPRQVETFLGRLPRLRELAVAAPSGARPLILLLAGWSAQRDVPQDQVGDLVELGWDDGRFLADGDNVVLPHAIAALVLGDRLERADELVAAIRASAQETGSVMQFVVASGHASWIEAQRGNLAIATAELRSCIEHSLELGIQIPAIAAVSYCADVLLERPDVDDLAALPETMELGPLSGVFAGAGVLQARGRLRFAAGRREDAIADTRHAGAIAEALGFTNPCGFPNWRSSLALMLNPGDRDEALALTRAEVADARSSGQARRIGIALRALGILDPDDDRGARHLEEAVAVLANSPAPLEYARALVELGAVRRRRGNRTRARAPLREGLDLALRCGALRLADRARTELAAAGARPRREYSTGRDALTPSELRVAQMAADGYTSKEIAQALFVTTATIDTHLHRTYAKLGIKSRKQIADALAQARS